MLQYCSVQIMTVHGKAGAKAWR